MWYIPFRNITNQINSVSLNMNCHMSQRLANRNKKNNLLGEISVDWEWRTSCSIFQFLSLHKYKIQKRDGSKNVTIPFTEDYQWNGIKINAKFSQLWFDSFCLCILFTKQIETPPANIFHVLGKGSILASRTRQGRRNIYDCI